MELYFREFGQGQPVIILHGLFGQSDNWVTIGKRIAESYHVFIPDQRNHGQSPRAPIHSFPAMADDLASFIDDHKIGNPILIGHSMGGKTAMMYALENTAVVDKLIVIDISPRRYPERSIHTKVIDTMLGIDLGATGSRSEVEHIVNERITDLKISMFVLKNLYRQQDGRLAWRINVEVINRSMDLLFDGIDSSVQFNKPVLFVKGGNSDYITDVDFPLIEKMFPQATIKTIAGASHWVHADAPVELCRLLSEFLGRDCTLPIPPLV